MLKSVKGKFIVSAMLIILFAAGGPVVFFIHQFNQNFEHRSMMTLETTKNVVLACLNHSMQHDKKNIQGVLERHALNENIESMRIFDKEGIINYASNSTEIEENIGLIATHHAEKNNLNKILLIEPDTLYSVLIPLKNGIKCQKCHEEKDIIAYLDIDSRLTRSEIRFFTGVRHSLFLGAFVIIILLLTLYFIFNHFISRPLNDVITGLDEVQKDNLKIRLPIIGDDEFSSLDKHFNIMVDKLETSQKEIKSFHFEQLQRADKLVTLGELAAEMAHEINNPAGVIMARTDYLKLEVEDKSGLQKYNEDLDVILHQTQKIAKITNNILKFSKKLPKNFHQVDIFKVICESVKMLEPRLIRRNIKFKNVYLCDKERKETIIFGDAQQLEQVFTNLINNAIDALSRGGNLEITIGNINNEKVQIVLKDDGSGMDEKSEKQIFLPFFTTKAAKKGTGLGLYIVKNILKNHSAEISCKSILDEGTTFTLLFNKVKKQ